MKNLLRENLIHLNELSKDIYNGEKRLSLILSELGFAPEQIDILQGEALQEFLNNIDFSLKCVLYEKNNGGKLFYVLYHRYGLFGFEKHSLQKMGEDCNASRERIRQLQNAAIKKLRQGAFETNICISACKTLNINAYDQLVKNTDEVETACLKSGKKPFFATEQMRAHYKPYEYPVTVTELARQINLLKPYEMKRLSYRWILNFLKDALFIEDYEAADGHIYKKTTEAGESIGIFTEQRTSERGTYTVLLYNTEAQQFIFDNIDAIADTGKLSDTRYEFQGTAWTKDQDDCLAELSLNGKTVKEMTDILKRSPKGIKMRLKFLGLTDKDI